VLRIVSLDNGITQRLTARHCFGRDLYPAASYLVDGLLVDTGTAREECVFLQSLDGISVRMIVNTHSHEDHIGCNGLLQSFRRLPVLAHPLALPVLRNPRLLSLLPYQRFLFGFPRPSDGEPIGDSVTTGRYAYRVLALPGHSRDHIGLFEETRGWLFSGDAYIGGRDRVLRRDYDVWDMIRTFRSLASLPINAMFTGTGHVLHDPVRRIERKLEYLLEMEEQVRDLKNAGMEEREIARRLFPGDLFLRLATSGHFAATHLVRSFLAKPPA